MAETRTAARQALGCVLFIICFPLLFVFQSLLGDLTNSHLVNLLLVGAAALGSTVILSFGAGILFGLFQVYQRIRAQLRYPVSPQIKLLQLDDLPAEFAPTIKNTAAALSPLGFGLIGCVKVAASGVTFYQGLLHNSRAGTIARCVLMVQDDQSQTLLAFQTRFSDGTECATGHMSPAYFARSVQARPKGRSGLAFFEIADPARLARLHQAATEQHHSSPVDTGIAGGRSDKSIWRRSNARRPFRSTQAI